MIKISSAFFATLLISISALGESESKAQLHLPWGLLNSRLQAAVGANSSTFSVDLPASQLEVAGIQWNLSGLSMKSHLSANSAAMTATHVGVRTVNSPIEMKIGLISVDQVVEKIINGVKVRIHLKASCGPLTLVQSLAGFSSLFKLDWSSGSPVSSLGNLDLSWPAGSWAVSEFKCAGPQGLPEILHEQIAERLGSAEEFRPLLAQFISGRVTSKIEESLSKIRAPFAVSSGKSKHVFQIGAMAALASGVLADVSVRSPFVGAGAGAGSAGGTSATTGSLDTNVATLEKVPLDRPALLGNLGLLDQIFKSEMSEQPPYLTIDMQANKSFHDLMQSRFTQFFVFADLMNYPKKSPFYLQIFRPEFSSLSVLDSGNLRTQFPLSAVVQSYRDGKWWSYLNLKGDTKAEVRLTVGNGVLSYETALSNKGVQLNYGAEYRERFKKRGNPPSSVASSALKGKQPALSGSVTWPVVDLGVGGQYKIDRLEWIESPEGLGKSQFILHWN